MKIFLSSPGRRVELIEILKKEINNLILIGGDYSITSPALSFCDKIYKLNYKINDEYIQNILNICIDENVDLIIPLIDPELELYAKHKELFNQNGIEVMISNEKDILMASDKMETYNFFKDLDFINTPKTCILKNFDKKQNFSDEIILKPKKGSSGIGIYKIKSSAVKDFTKIMNLNTSDYIVQDYIDFEYEVTTDIFVYEKEVIELCQRQRLKTRGGEVERGKTIKNKEINDIIIKIIGLTNFMGIINIQIMIKDGSYYIGEINSRLGGGFPLSYYSGANMIEHLNCLITRSEKEKHLDYRYKEDFYMLRYDNAIYKDFKND